MTTQDVDGMSAVAFVRKAVAAFLARVKLGCGCAPMELRAERRGIECASCGAKVVKSR